MKSRRRRKGEKHYHNTNDSAVSTLLMNQTQHRILEYTLPHSKAANKFLFLHRFKKVEQHAVFRFSFFALK